MGQVKQTLLERLHATIEPVVAAQGMELVDVAWQKEGGRQFLRIFIDKPGGVMLDDCATVSRALDEPLEALDLDQYHLEVSSPGAERPLKTDRDLERFCGRLVEVRTSPPVDGIRKFRGKLLGHDAGQLRLDIDGRDVAVPRANITTARLALVMPGSQDDTEGGRPVISLEGRRGECDEIGSILCRGNEAAREGPGHQPAGVSGGVGGGPAGRLQESL